MESHAPPSSTLIRVSSGYARAWAIAYGLGGLLLLVAAVTGPGGDDVTWYATALAVLPATLVYRVWRAKLSLDSASSELLYRGIFRTTRIPLAKIDSLGVTDTLLLPKFRLMEWYSVPAYVKPGGVFPRPLYCFVEPDEEGASGVVADVNDALVAQGFGALPGWFSAFTSEGDCSMRLLHTDTYRKLWWTCDPVDPVGYTPPRRATE